MASSKIGEAAHKSGSSPKGKWIFSKKEMLSMASLREGMDEFKELQFRQQSTKFIQLLGDRLNQHLKDNRGKITQLCMCAAMIHMHRFFYFHSFTFFDYRDVAAACLFLSGKSEECPRKIDHIVRAWWSEKFPGIKLDQQKYEDAMGLLVAIESVILQTIAFDLQVALPHPLVLKAMHTLAKNNRKITEVVYFFSTDVLCVTSWGIRYSAEAIAVACVHIVCTWANYEMPAFVDGVRWYHKTDPTMTEEQLQEMMREFITVYRTCRNDLAITKFIKKGEIRDPISDRESADRATPPALQADAADMRLPPPPPPPLSLAKKVDMAAYKERRAADASAGGGGHSGHHGQSGGGGGYGGSSSSAAGGNGQQQPPRRSFMPEMSQVKGVTASMPGFVPPSSSAVSSAKQESGGDRKPDYARDDAYRSSSSSSSQQQHHQQRPPSNGGSSSSARHPAYMQQQQPSGSGEQRLQQQGRSSEHHSAAAAADRDRHNEKRKREASTSSLNPEKRSRVDAPSGMQQQSQHHRGHSSSSSHQQQQQQQQVPLHHATGGLGGGGYNSVPPPTALLQQQQPSSSYGKHYGGQPQPMMNGLQQQQHSQQSQQHHRASYGSSQQSSGYAHAPPPSAAGGYGLSQQHQQQLHQNGYGMQTALPPPHKPVLTGNDLEDGEVY